MGKINVQRVDHVAIDVSDVDKSAYFYGKLLGMTETPRPESFDFPGVWYDLGNMVLHLVGGREAKVGPHHFALWVDDVHQAADILMAEGFEAQWDPYKIIGVERFFTFDPDGNRVEIQGKEK